MSQPFIGEIRAFGFSFAPRGWALCNGQLLSIQQNAALFSLLGTTYGGNGQTNFQLPDLRGRAALTFGQGPGLSNYVQGQVTGTETVTLLSTQIPQHNHIWSASTSLGNQPGPAAGFLAGGQIPNGTPIPNFAAAGGATVPLATTTLSTTGTNQGHNNMQPYLVVSYCIALQGIFPSRN
ncbi:phage tail protein [Sphingomonas sp. MMS24-J45]|uniref:phage tail protein n=1 Tax=Sphingomonas sp. MMS24-J45 TaxID=3238806 RepID=UPI00384D05CB